MHIRLDLPQISIFLMENQVNCTSSKNLFMDTLQSDRDRESARNKSHPEGSNPKPPNLEACTQPLSNKPAALGS